MLEANPSQVSRRFTGQTDVGEVRTVNQDSFYLDESQSRFFIVADGMGGHAGGQEASEIATEYVKSYLNKYWDSDIPSPELLQKAIISANEGILEDQQAHPERRDMGTTLVLIAFRHDGAWRAHIGDSRLYCLRAGKLSQVTEDQTWIARALKNGDIEPDQAKVHPWRHVLFQCLGRQDLNAIEIAALEVQQGDLFMMCSDGLSEEVPDELIEEVLASQLEPKEMALELIEEAKNAGGSDNITIVLVAQDEKL
ncbi:MAG: PP2C family protein-serine/threonine phosphatase [Microcystaceae cyanobacterium]